MQALFLNCVGSCRAQGCSCSLVGAEVFSRQTAWLKGLGPVVHAVITKFFKVSWRVKVGGFGQVCIVWAKSDVLSGPCIWPGFLGAKTDVI